MGYTYPQFYRPRPVIPPQVREESNGMSSDQVKKLVMEALKQQAAESGGAGGASSGGLMGGAAGAGGYAALSGTGQTALAAPSMSGAFSSPSLLAPEIAAVDVGGSAAAATPATGMSAASIAGPALFMATAPLWAPKLAKGGQKFAELTGISKPKPNRKFKASETAQSKVFNRQIPGFDKLDEQQKEKIATAAHDAGILRMPGHADEEGNTQSGIGMDLVRPRFMSNPDYWENLKNTKGIGSSQYHLQTTPIEELAKEGRDEKLNSFIKATKDIMDNPAQVSKVGSPSGLSSILGGGPAMIQSSPNVMQVSAPKRKDSPGFKDGKRINYGRR